MGPFDGLRRLVVEAKTKPTDDLIYHDDELVIVPDRYPKAKYHFLVLPTALLDGRNACIPSISLRDYP